MVVSGTCTFTNLLDPVTQEDAVAEFRSKMREEVIAGLINSHPSTKKWLPVHYCYDALGSKLFKQVTLDPNYYITRTETELLESERVSSEILRVTDPHAILDLGAGDCEKPKILLKAATAKGSEFQLREFWPLDMDEAILRDVCPRLASEFPSIDIRALTADFELQFDAIAGEVRGRREGPILVTFFGSTFSGIESEHGRLAFLRSIRALFSQGAGGDHLLLGLDLVGPESRMLAAYDNPPANVTKNK
jgi:L-histidine Nalpha-methyltransferase